MADKASMVLDAQRKGFSVAPNDDETGWLVLVPARPRRPAQELGDYKTHERAWSAACLIARDLPDLRSNS